MKICPFHWALSQASLRLLGNLLVLSDSSLNQGNYFPSQKLQTADTCKPWSRGQESNGHLQSRAGFSTHTSAPGMQNKSQLSGGKGFWPTKVTKDGNWNSKKNSWPVTVRGLAQEEWTVLGAEHCTSPIIYHPSLPIEVNQHFSSAAFI